MISLSPKAIFRPWILPRNSTERIESLCLLDRFRRRSLDRAIHPHLAWLKQSSITIRRHLLQHAAFGVGDASFESRVGSALREEGGGELREGSFCREALAKLQHRLNLKSMDSGVSQSDKRALLQMRIIIKDARDIEVCGIVRRCLSLVSYHKLTGAPPRK